MKKQLRSNKSIVTGLVLQLRLARTTSPVKWFSRDGVVLGSIAPSQALIIAKNGVYEGKANNGRVYFIREVDPRPLPFDDSHYRDDRAVIHYHTDMRASRPIHVRNQETADNWDGMLHRSPAPLSWQRV